MLRHIPNQFIPNQLGAGTRNVTHAHLRWCESTLPFLPLLEAFLNSEIVAMMIMIMSIIIDHEHHQCFVLFCFLIPVIHVRSLSTPTHSTAVKSGNGFSIPAFQFPLHSAGWLIWTPTVLSHFVLPIQPCRMIHYIIQTTKAFYIAHLGGFPNLATPQAPQRVVKL